jgi:hypothetical protein
MTRVQVTSGICGFETQIEVEKKEKRKAGLSISSNCRQVGSLGRALRELTLMEVLKPPIHQNPVYERAGQCGLHNSCPVPSGILKAAEVELGLALKKDAVIQFQEKD